jgi:hypothetical protein
MKDKAMKHRNSSAQPQPTAADWKRTLQDVIQRYNGAHATKHKTVSNRTMEQRASGLFRSFTTLRGLGSKFNPVNLGGRHIELLVRYWTADPTLFAELKASNTKTTIKPLLQPHSAAYIQQQLSFLRVYSKWIGKAGLVKTPTSYVSDPSLVTRCGVAQRDHSWSAAGVDIQAVLERVERIDPRVALQLEVVLAFGLRRKEAVMFRPGLAEVPAHALPANTGDDQRYVAFLRVKRGTKGGRLRYVAIRTDFQRTVLERALACAGSASSHIGIPALSLKQALDRYSYVLRAAGVTAKMLGVTGHGLRHQFAGDLFYELSGVAPPVAGGKLNDADHMRAAYLEVARQLGHGRPQVSGAYLGGRTPRYARDHSSRSADGPEAVPPWSTSSHARTAGPPHQADDGEAGAASVE